MTNADHAHPLKQLVVFHGDLNSQQAHVYARLAAAASQTNWRLRGRVAGPTSCLTRTLTAAVDLQELGPGGDLLARAVVPDPCFWAPGEPYLYSVRVELVVDTRVLAADSRTLGLRRLGVNGQRLLLDAQPWLMLGARDVQVESAAWEAWRHAGLVCRMAAPSEQQCQEASLHGVMLIADVAPGIAAESDALAQELIRLSRHASVAIAALPESAVTWPERRNAAPNLLLAQQCPTAGPARPRDWADLVILPAHDGTKLPAELAGCQLPVLVQFLREDRVPLSVAAEQCSQLVQSCVPVPRVAGVLV